MKEAPSACSANYVPLTPITFLERAATVYADKPSVVYGDVRFAWKETHGRCLRLASALVHLGISHPDIVAALAPNIPEHYELHFAVPMAGAVISALNTKLDATTLSVILEQLEAKIMFVDYQFVDVALNSFHIMSQRKCKPPLLVVIPDYNKQPPFVFKNLPPDALHFNQLLEKGQADFKIRMPSSECDPISVNYTSGSTGTPKGAVYSHRGGHLNSAAAVSRFDMKPMPVFLWTVDMFRCNGWGLAWAMASLGGTNVCLRNVSAKAMFDAIFRHNVTHLCGPPALLNEIADAPQSEHKPLPPGVSITVAGVLPPCQVFCKVAELGFNVNVGYGMTEAMGPVLVRPWKPNSGDEPTEQLSYGDQGRPILMMEGIDVKDPNTMESTPCDGRTIGEIMFKGNTMMLGYLKNQQATKEAFREGWYRTGDLATRQKDGSIRLKDRAKDMIYSKGEAVSSLEVEAVLLSHPKVLNAAVVGKYDEHTVESPFAVIKLKEGCGATVEDIIRFCKARLETHMVPQSVVFGELPVNSTGKVQKFLIREKIKCAG
ncbi:probable acyl-activating enzyme 1, peroxisomal [Neltuma alba]|uniref:probable acyl-activating enzyme 1, peroxisomal n=1 Tax=Neltuma alba TaxID=207710 RepID=UPI0010A47885|nr:probable acyl-activating enzyme 1, peroxisomal [Prosopis alba]